MTVFQHLSNKSWDYQNRLTSAEQLLVSYAHGLCWPQRDKNIPFILISKRNQQKNRPKDYFKQHKTIAYRNRIGLTWQYKALFSYILFGWYLIIVGFAYLPCFDYNYEPIYVSPEITYCSSTIIIDLFRSLTARPDILTTVLLLASIMPTGN